jgi:hypothetical protein
MIEEATVEYPEVALKELCELFGVSRSWYYEKPKADKQRAREDVALRDAIERIILEFPGYGYRRVTQALLREGWIVNHKKVLRVDEERVASVPVEEALQADHRLLTPLRDLPEPHQRCLNR